MLAASRCVPRPLLLLVVPHPHKRVDLTPPPRPNRARSSTAPSPGGAYHPLTQVPLDSPVSVLSSTTSEDDELDEKQLMVRHALSRLFRVDCTHS